MNDIYCKIALEMFEEAECNREVEKLADILFEGFLAQHEAKQKQEGESSITAEHQNDASSHQQVAGEDS